MKSAATPAVPSRCTSGGRMSASTTLWICSFVPAVMFEIVQQASCPYAMMHMVSHGNEHCKKQRQQLQVLDPAAACGVAHSTPS